MKRKIALGLSGGVDSAVSAYLLKSQGFDVTAIYLECWRAPGCRAEEDRQDALKVALQLDLPFEVLDFTQNYKERVVNTFLADYRAGRTPNPDVWCNREIKFGLFYDWAQSHGFDAVATGHYAKIDQVAVRKQPHSVLCTPKDRHKDQTYFLCLLKANQLAHVIFPLADLTKPAVRDLAAQQNLPVAQKPDSVGICFIGEIDVRGFLREHLGEQPGYVVDEKGNRIGTHQGLWFYTIGQRHGFQIQANQVIQQVDGSTITRQAIPPFYVLAKKPATNELVVGFGAHGSQTRLHLTDLNWLLAITELDQVPLFVRIRHGGELIPIASWQLHNQDLQLELAKPAQGIAPGQVGVIYAQIDDQLVCLGGGYLDI